VEAVQFGDLDRLKFEAEDIFIARDDRRIESVYDYTLYFEDEKTGSTPLHTAASIGHAEIVKYLVMQRLVPVDATDRQGKTPLHDSCISGTTKVAKLLIEEHHCILDAVDYEGRNAFHYACWRNHLELAKYLQGRGIRVNVTDKQGRTALDDARNWGHDQIVAYLQGLPEFKGK
jgi:ankyrin repeat protein